MSNTPEICRYLCPRQLGMQGAMSPACDIYSLGCLMWEMLHAQPLWVGLSQDAILARVAESQEGLPFARHIPAPVQVRSGALAACLGHLHSTAPSSAVPMPVVCITTCICDHVDGHSSMLVFTPPLIATLPPLLHLVPPQHTPARLTSQRQHPCPHDSKGRAQQAHAAALRRTTCSPPPPPHLP